MIYVDDATWKKSESGRKTYAHMISSVSHVDLHEFAASIGVKRHFFHSSSAWKHYDITFEQREIAIAHGAQAVDTRELLKILKEHQPK